MRLDERRAAPPRSVPSLRSTVDPEIRDWWTLKVGPESGTRIGDGAHCARGHASPHKQPYSVLSMLRYDPDFHSHLRLIFLRTWQEEKL